MKSNEVGKIIKLIKEKNGITLVALVVTIVVLMILSTVTINAVLGDNGLIKQAQKSKDMATNSIEKENENLNKLEQEYANLMEEDSKIPDPEPPIPPVPPEPPIYIDGEVAEAPTVGEGMTPVKWNGSNWVKTTISDTEWYNYAQKKWANVVLGDATFNGNTLDESKAYSMLVWIPRYAYQITSQYHQNGDGAGNINVVFIDTVNQNKDKTKTYSETYQSYTTGSGMSDYVVHPAFNYGGTKLAGIWVGKYETSHTGCTTDKTTGHNNTDVTTLTSMIKAGVTSWRNIQVSNIFTVCTEMNKSGNPYGLNTSDIVVDPHMMKNSEWGAVAYLSKSKYGKETEEVWINPNSNYITGQAGSSVSASETTSTNAYNTSNGQKASTTGNTTGVYDMRGGAFEYTGAYVNNENSYLTKYGSTLVNAASKYKDVYSKGSSDDRELNYQMSTPDRGHYGDALWETSNSGNGSSRSWYGDYSHFPYSNMPIFHRGGYYSNASNAGVFGFGSYTGYGSSYSFRVVVPVF